MRLASKMQQRHSVLFEAAAGVLARLPPAPRSVLLAAGLNHVLGQGIQPGWLLPLRDKTLCIRVRDARLTFFLGADCAGFVARRFSRDPQLTIAAGARDFFKLVLREEDPDTLFFGRLCMEGDTELGRLTKNILDSVDPSRLFILRLLPNAGWAKIRGRLLP